MIEFSSGSLSLYMDLL